LYSRSGGPPAANSSHVKIPPARERQPPKEPAVKALDKKKPVLASQPSKNIVCQTILSGTYQPFADNPSKQLRYEAYLSGKRKFNDKESANFTEWEKHKELEEFSRKTRLLRPLTTQLSDKFTHGGTISAETSEDTSYKKDDASSEAAMMGMFGIMTRETFQWHPHKMLCRRFNIPSPYPNSDVVGVPQDVSKEKKRNEVEFASSNVVVQNDEQFDVEEEEEQKEDEENFEEQSVLELEESVRRPPHSTFVSIFADDSSSDEQENEEEEAQDQVEESSAIKGWQNLSLISQQTLTQPVDVPIKIPSAQEPHPPVVPMETATSHDTEEFFGPPLPPPLDDTSLDHHDDNLQDNGHHSDHHHHHHKKRKHSSSHKKVTI
jgi:G patch domain-containing protein 1